VGRHKADRFECPVRVTTARDNVNGGGSMKKRAWWIAVAALAAVVVYVSVERASMVEASRATVADDQPVGEAEKSGVGTSHDGGGADLPREDRSSNRPAHASQPPGFEDTSPNVSLGVATVPTTRVSSECTSPVFTRQSGPPSSG
jgi:hypothetical protein